MKLHRIIVAAVFALAACSLPSCISPSRSLELRKPADRLEPGNDAIVLMTLKTSNKVRPSFQPKFGMVNIDKKAYGNMWYTTRAVKSSPKEFNEYILSMKVKSGSRQFRWILVGDNIPGIHSAGADISMNTNMNLAPGGVYYLGRMEAVLRKKNPGEKAAAILPLIDAAIAGYSLGAWDVTIKDDYANDMALINSCYPATKEVKVERLILPPWKRPM